MQAPTKAIDEILKTPLGEAAHSICEQLQQHGFNAYWVGGVVRDLLLELPVQDIDIATSATPSEVATLFTVNKDSNTALGTSIVTKNQHTFEITTFRTESGTTAGRTPTAVEFSNQTEDAARRDFTINAIYLDPVTQCITDEYMGINDAHEKLVRFIGNPAERIIHDPLRSLRAIRLRNGISGQYHPATYQAIRKNANVCAQLSGLRLQQELEKMLLGPNPAQCLEDLWETGILTYILPELDNCRGVAQPHQYHNEGDVWQHLLQTIQASRPDDEIDVRLAALLHDIGKVDTFSIEADRIHFNDHASASAETATVILQRLHYSNKRIKKITWLIAHHMMIGQLLDINEERKHHWYFHEYFTELLRVFWLDIAGTTPSNFTLYEQVVADYNQFLDAHPAPTKPLLTGEEIMQYAQLEAGPAIGKLAATLAEQQKAGAIQYKQEAIDFIKQQLG